MENGDVIHNCSTQIRIEYDISAERCHFGAGVAFVRIAFKIARVRRDMWFGASVALGVWIASKCDCQKFWHKLISPLKWAVIKFTKSNDLWQRLLLINSHLPIIIKSSHFACFFVEVFSKFNLRWNRSI